MVLYSTIPLVRSYGFTVNSLISYKDSLSTLVRSYSTVFDDSLSTLVRSYVRLWYYIQARPGVLGIRYLGHF